MPGPPPRSRRRTRRCPATGPARRGPAGRCPRSPGPRRRACRRSRPSGSAAARAAAWGSRAPGRRVHRTPPARGRRPAAGATSPWWIQEISHSSITMSPRNSARSAGSRSFAATRASTIFSGPLSYASLQAPTTSARTCSVSTEARNRANASSHASSLSYESTAMLQATDSGAGRSPVPSGPFTDLGKRWTGRPWKSSRWLPMVMCAPPLRSMSVGGSRVRARSARCAPGAHSAAG